MARDLICNMGNCLETVGDNGIAVTLRRKDRYDAQRAVFCCARHAALAMLALAEERGEGADAIPVPRYWKSV